MGDEAPLTFIGFNINSEWLKFNYTGKDITPERKIWDDLDDPSQSRGYKECTQSGWKKNVRTTKCRFPC